MNNRNTEFASSGYKEWILERGGIININKPAGLTSHDVVGRIRRLLSIKKVGHTGTLDPMATGVLPICLGRATRIMEYLDMDRKTYLCTMRLGREYDTQDLTGEVIGEVPEDAVNAITESSVRDAFSVFRGMIYQVPPLYSAIKIQGRKLYEYARCGREAQILDKIKPRQVYIWDLTLESMSLGRGYESEVRFSVTCSKGTYIRAICQEAGKRLGVGGAMASLVRSGSGNFVLKDSVELAQLEEMDPEAICRSIRAPEEALTAFGEVHLHGSLDIRRITT
jgi:tRNA pseudouridine55 synthase